MARAEQENVDPRVLRTRRDVVDAATALFLSEGWGAVTHAEVARRAGYSKATVYAHWPTQLDLVSAAVRQICDVADHPAATGDLRADLIRGLVDFADDLSRGRLDRILGGVLERAGSDPVVDELRQQLFAAGTQSLTAILRDHLRRRDVEPARAMLVGGVFLRVAFEGRPASRSFVEDLVDRVLATAVRRDAAA